MNNTILVLGGDGYLGWSVALALANRTDYRVVIVDNLSKRKWEKEVGVESLVELASPEARVESYRKLYRRTNLEYQNGDLRDLEFTIQLVKTLQPKVIINAAQQPSAPFSMMSAQNARTTFDNNSTTNLNIAWAIRTVSTDIKYITLGSAGSYLSIDSDFIPTGKVNLRFTANNALHSVANTWLPMQANDFYHQSKVNAFLLNDLSTTLWGLRTITVQQSTIFGHAISENEDPAFHALSTRLNYDHIFGTVVNRFVCQAIVGHPITVYGDGSQRTGIISLADTVDNFVRLCEAPVDHGKHRVEHNFTHTRSINDLAEQVASISNVKVQRQENPRFEPASVHTKVFEQSKLNQSRIDDEETFKKSLQALYLFVSTHKDKIHREYLDPSVYWRDPVASARRDRPALSFKNEKWFIPQAPGNESFVGSY